MELEQAGAPVVGHAGEAARHRHALPRHTRNLMDREPNLPAAVYSPQVVARTILHCAERPTREITVGGGGRMITAMSTVAPRLTDRYLEATMFEALKTDVPTSPRRRDTLHRSHRHGAEESGAHEGHIARSSLYTGAQLHPLRALLGAGMLFAGVAIAARPRDGVTR